MAIKKLSQDGDGDPLTNNTVEVNKVASYSMDEVDEESKYSLNQIYLKYGSLASGKRATAFSLKKNHI